MKNGKGSTPRNLSKRFMENYDLIKWSKTTVHPFTIKNKKFEFHWTESGVLGIRNK